MFINLLSNHKRLLIIYKRILTPIDNTFLGVRRSMGGVASFRPTLPGDNSLVSISGQLCMSLPMLALACLVLDFLLPVSPFVGRCLQC